MKTAFFLVFCGLLAAVSAERATLVLQRHVTTEFVKVLAEKRNFTVAVDIHNVGDGPAHDVTFNDPWSADQYTVIEGTPQHEWPIIAPKEKISFNFTLTPAFSGTQAPLRASVEYKPEAEAEAQVLLSMPSEEYRVISFALYEKLTDRHYPEWGVFAAGVGFTTLIPFLLWLKARKVRGGTKKRQ